jgi:hypothetical protein
MGRRAQLREVVDEVVGKAVVVIDDEDHDQASRRDRRPRQAYASLKRILTVMGAGGGVKLAAEQDIADKIAAAKAKLVVVEPKPISPYAALGAAALAAAAAVVMAGVVVLGPGVRFDERPATYAP